MLTDTKNNAKQLSPAWFDQHISGDAPDNLRRVAEVFCRTYNIKGLCDPMYIINVTAVEMDWGDGCGVFKSALDQQAPTAEVIQEAASRLRFSYSRSVGDDSMENIVTLITQALNAPANEFNSMNDPDDDLHAAAEMFDSLKSGTDVHTLTEKILAEKYLITVTPTAMNGILGEYVCSKLTLTEVIERRMMTGELDSAIVEQLPGYIPPALIGEDERRQRFVDRMVERHMSREWDVHHVYKGHYGDLFLQRSDERDVDYVRRCATQNANDAEYGGAVFQWTYNSIARIHAAQPTTELPVNGIASVAANDLLRLSYANEIVSKYVAGDESILLAIKTAYGDTHIQDDSETTVDYIRRCAEQDFFDGEHDAAIFQETYDFITGRDEPGHTPS